jgi:dephospho-CoA kinase
MIGISGKIGSGKDTACDIIISHDPTWTRVAFADKLKKIVSILTNQEEVTRYDKIKYTKVSEEYTIGQLYQIVGTGMKELINNNIWIKSLFTDPSLPTKIIVSDVRFPEEARAIEDKGGIILRIIGDPLQIRRNNLDKRNLEHISETALDDYPFKYTVNNSSTIEDFQRNILSFLRDIETRKI